MSKSKQIISVFEKYQNSRISFVQEIAQLASRTSNIDTLQQLGVMDLLRPLLLDSVPSVQQCAAQALGRLANFRADLAEAVVTSEVLPQLVYALSQEDNLYYKRYAAFVLRSVAKHNALLAEAVVHSGAVAALVDCLDEFDPKVKESAAWALGNIAKHNAELAQAVADEGAVPALVVCVQEPELSLKRVAASALSFIASHSPALAQSVVDAEGIPNLVPLIESHDGKLKRQVCSCLSHIATHSIELAELVVEGEVFPKMFLLLRDTDATVAKNACTCIREIVKHSKELAKLVVHAGGLPAIVAYVANASPDTGAKIPGIGTLGFISAFQETLAYSVVKAKAIAPLGVALSSELTSERVKEAAAWSLGQIGVHSSDHARAVADGNILPMLMRAYLSDKSAPETQDAAKGALKNIIQKCTYLDALDTLLHVNAPQNILKYIVAQYAKVLPTDVEAKKKFVTSRGLAKLQVIKQKAEPGTPLYETIDLINQNYPEEVVNFYAPDQAEKLLQMIEEN